jgi:hypothetical protein
MYHYLKINMVAIASAIVVAVWGYFGIIERLNRLGTNEKLMSQDLLKKAEQTPKNQEMFMLIEYQAKSLEKHSKQLEENVNTKVVIQHLEKRIDKLEKESRFSKGYLMFETSICVIDVFKRQTRWILSNSRSCRMFRTKKKSRKKRKP